MIQVQGLTKRYGQRTAIQDVTFHVADGEILGFLGPNGAGKSTTMRILAGCLAASEGTARVAGYDVFEQSLEARAHLGYLPEQVPLYPEMRVDEYLAFAGSLRVSGGIPRSRYDEVVERCGLRDVRDRPIGRLSRGYRQRVGLAQAILPNPRVLILDEPTVGLDPRQIIEVRELIRDLAGEHTVLLSTHILPEVSMLCGRVVIIDHGRVVAEDSPDNLRRVMRGGESLLVEVEGPAEAIQARLRAVAGVADATCTAPGAVSRWCIRTTAPDEAAARRIRRDVAAVLTEPELGLLELTAERLTLEDVFVRLITSEAV